MESITSLDILETTSHQPDGPQLDDGHRILKLYCATCGRKQPVKLRCGSRICPDCRRKDFWRLAKGYSNAVQVMKAPKLMTLTLINKSDLSQDEVKRLRSSFVKLMRRKYYRSKVRGGLYAIEVVNKGKGWNIHMHVLLDANYIDQKQISQDWRELTGDSYIVDIRIADSPKKGLHYILKYLSKPPQLNGEDAKNQYQKVLKGVRLVQPFGSLYRDLKLEHRDLACPKCGGFGWISSFEVDSVFEEFLRKAEDGFS